MKLMNFDPIMKDFSNVSLVFGKRGKERGEEKKEVLWLPGDLVT